MIIIVVLIIRFKSLQIYYFLGYFHPFNYCLDKILEKNVIYNSFYLN